jgi:hypothetical protein
MRKTILSPLTPALSHGGERESKEVDYSQHPPL